MKKILIINPPYYRLQNASLIHYPAGCCYMAAVLERAGFRSLIYNADFDPKKKTILGNTNHLNVRALTEASRQYAKRLKSQTDPVWREIKNYLQRFQPDLLVISVFSTTLTSGERIAKMAKQMNPKVTTIFEGCFNRGLHCAIDPAVNGDWSVMDFAIRKEPEETVVELVKALEKAKPDFVNIKGLSWKNNGKIMHNEDRSWIANLDQLPFPSRHLLDGYEKMPPHAFQGIYGSRGCPFDCSFCGCHIGMGYEPRLRSAKNMVAEIESTFHRFGTRYFYLCDDIIFINKTRAREFCRLLIKKKLPIYWSAQSRAEMVDEETLRLMKKSGGQHVAVGVEVGNPKVRAMIKKGNTVEEVIHCAELIRRAGLRMVAFCLIGLPWEGRQEIRQTVDLIKKIKPYIVYPYLPAPAKGTLLNEQVGKIKEKMIPRDRKKVIEWALNELVKLNKHNLIFDIISRPGFYWALANDMRLFKNPSYLLGYLRDFFNV